MRQFTNNRNPNWVKLELDHLSFALFVTSQFKMFGTLDRDLHTPLAIGALQTQHQLFGRFGL